MGQPQQKLGAFWFWKSYTVLLQIIFWKIGISAFSRHKWHKGVVKHVGRYSWIFITRKVEQRHGAGEVQADHLIGSLGNLQKTDLTSPRLSGLEGQTSQKGCIWGTSKFVIDLYCYKICEPLVQSNFWWPKVDWQPPKLFTTLLTIWITQ